MSQITLDNKWSAKYLKLVVRRMNFDISTVIDVGVARGTPELYRAFRHQKILLVEPLSIYDNTMELHMMRYDAEWVRCAAGSKNGETTIHVDVKQPSMSTLHEKTKMASGSDSVIKEKVQIKTLDSIVSSTKSKGPFVLKIDSEGHELEVVKGATKTLKSTDIVIAEVSVSKRYEESYSFSEFIAEMAKHGFEILDVMSSSITPPKFMDVIFTKVPWKKSIPTRQKNQDTQMDEAVEPETKKTPKKKLVVTKVGGKKSSSKTATKKKVKADASETKASSSTSSKKTSKTKAPSESKAESNTKTKTKPNSKTKAKPISKRKTKSSKNSKPKLVDGTLSMDQVFSKK